MKNRSYRSIIFVSVLCMLSMTQAGFWSWLGYPAGPAPVTDADRGLSDAVNRGNPAEVQRFLSAGANPNAKVEGDKSIFVQAFERALVRNDEGKITGVDEARADIAYYLAGLKVNIDDLNRYIEAHYMFRGRLVPTLFRESRGGTRNIALEVFSHFVKDLQDIARRHR